jgi:uncharacterized protein YpmB
MQFFIGIMTGLFVAVIVAVAYVAGLHDRKVKPTLPQVDNASELEKRRTEQLRKDFNSIMNYNAEQALAQRVE